MLKIQTHFPLCWFFFRIREAFTFTFQAASMFKCARDINVQAQLYYPSQGPNLLYYPNS